MNVDILKGNGDGMDGSKPAIVILNMDSNGLGVARSLARSGLNIIGVDWRKDAIGFTSRYCARSVQVAHPTKNPEQTLTQLLNLGRTLGSNAVLTPTADFFLEFMSHHRDVLSKEFLFNIPDRMVLDSILDKTRQYQLLKSLDAPIAHTCAPANLTALRTECRDFMFPLFIKGGSSHLWSDCYKNKGFIVRTMIELESRFVDAIAKGIAPVIQEIIIGPDRNHFKVCAYYGRQDGRLLGLFSTRKQRQFPTGFGVGSLMVSERRQDLIDITLPLLDRLRYRGIASIEFKLDKRDGKFKIIEINPRFWQQNIQAAVAGVNFAELYWRDVTGQIVHPAIRFKDGVKWHDLNQDLQSFLANRRKGDVGFGEWLRSLFGINCHAWFSWKDPWPAIRHSRFGLNYLRFPFKLIRDFRLSRLKVLQNSYNKSPVRITN